MDGRFYRENPYGSARLGTQDDARRLDNPNGPVAVIGNTCLRLPDQEPGIIIGGAGSAKFSCLGAYQLVHPSTGSFFMLDVGGQYMSTSWHWNLAAGRDAYAVNPFGVSAYPDINHPVDLWSILQADDDLFDNAKRIIAMGVVNQDSKGENAWVGQSAKRWGSRIAMQKVLLEGRVTPRGFWETLNRIDTDDAFLKAIGRSSEGMPYNIYSTLVEMYAKKHNSEKEWGAIIGCLKDSFDWLSSPKAAAAVSGDADYLPELADPGKKVGVYYAQPSGSGTFNESLTRMVVGIAQLHCVRAGRGARPLFFIEEAVSCGGADFIKSAVSEFRKFFRTLLVYQSHGQLVHLMGKAGAEEIIDSCGMQLYMGGGIREISSARRLADTVGKVTIQLDDPMAQGNHRLRSEQARLAALLEGADPLKAAHIAGHEGAQSGQRRKSGRYALDPAEILGLKDEVLVISPGSGLPPVLANKLPAYWTNPAMAGRYGPDPLFPPLDRLGVQGRFFQRTRRFIREDVPRHLAHWPNHANGQVAYVQGYRTW